MFVFAYLYYCKYVSICFLGAASVKLPSWNNLLEGTVYNITVNYRVGWSHFWRKKKSQSRVESFLKKKKMCAHVTLYCSRLFWDPKSKILLLSVAFLLGLRKCLKSLKTKISITETFYFKFLKVSPETKFVPYFYLKAKKKRNSTKNLFYYILGQKPFFPFLKNKKIPNKF